MSDIDLIRAAAADLERARIEHEMQSQRNIANLSAEERITAREDLAIAEARVMRAEIVLVRAKSKYASAE